MVRPHRSSELRMQLRGNGGVCAIAFIVAAVRCSAAMAESGIAPRATASEPPPSLVLRGQTMGTAYTIKIAAGDRHERNVSPEVLQLAIDDLLQQFDLQMSTWRPDSEASRFNRAPAGEWFPVSQATAFVVSKALDIHEQTGGASDITVGPLLRLWNFGPDAREKAAQLQGPDDSALNAARRCIGAQHLHVRVDPPGLRKDVAELEVDLSSLAPGYAVDLIIDLLAERGIDNAMVELGGEVRAIGARPDGAPWRIGVESPSPLREIARIVPLANIAAATSGDYRNYRTIEDQRVGHIFDPRTGRPLPYRGATVTVLAPTCLEADALSTPLFVMGFEAAYAWCVERDVAAMFQAPSEVPGRYVRRATPKFDRLAPPAN